MPADCAERRDGGRDGEAVLLPNLRWLLLQLRVDRSACAHKAYKIRIEASAFPQEGSQGQPQDEEEGGERKGGSSCGSGREGLGGTGVNVQSVGVAVRRIGQKRLGV